MRFCPPVCLVAILLGTCLSQAQVSVIPLPDGAPIPFSMGGVNLSGDGSTVLLNYTDDVVNPTQTYAARWVVGQPLQLLRVPGTPGEFNRAVGVSADGRRILLTYLDGPPVPSAVWDVEDGYTPLPLTSWAISANGSFVAGLTRQSGVLRAHSIQIDSGLPPEPPLYFDDVPFSVAWVSDDGQTVAGHDFDTYSLGRKTFGGVAEVVSNIFPYDFADDGSACGFFFQQLELNRLAVVWRAGELIVLPTAPDPGSGFEDHAAMSIATGGTRAVGWSRIWDQGVVYRPWYWSEGEGMLWIDDMLEERGMNLQGLRVHQNVSISDNGFHVAGIVTNLQTGAEHAWTMAVPSPSGSVVFGLGAALVTSRRRRVRSVFTPTA